MKTLKDYLEETIRRYGPVGSNRGVGFTVNEESDEELDEDADENDPLLAKAIDDEAVGPMEESVDEELALILSRAKLTD